MDARLVLAVVALVSFGAFAEPAANDEASAKARAEALAKSNEKPPDIVIVDDVGVGDHFPSHVPGAAPYRLPPREDVAPPPAPAAPEQPVSDPGEWATIPAAAPQPPKPVAPAPQAAPVTPPVPAAVAAPVKVPELERETLERASNSLLQGNCETELPRLAELSERTESSDTKARVRILRARCFTQRAKLEKAKAEYLTYLSEFPNGRWVAEARDAAGLP